MKHMHHHHDHEIVDHDDQPPWWLGPLKIIMGLFLISMMVMWIFYPWLSNKMYSDTLKNPLEEPIQVGEYTVTLSSPIAKSMQRDYVDDHLFEKKWCLKGTKQGNFIRITGLYIPKIYDRDVTHVHSAGCDEETIISVHSHPFRNCIPSQQDWKSFDQSSALLFGVMCEKDDIALFARQEGN